MKEDMSCQIILCFDVLYSAVGHDISCSPDISLKEKKKILFLRYLTFNIGKLQGQNVTEILEYSSNLTVNGLLH